MLLKKSRVVYIDTRWLFIKLVAVILAVAAVFTYWNWTRVTEIEFSSNEMDARWRTTDAEMIRNICSEIKKSRKTAGIKPSTNAIGVSLYSKKEIREYLWDGSDCLLDRKNGYLIEPNSNLKEYLKLAVREIKNRSPFGELIVWNEVRGVFKIGSSALIRDIDTGIIFSALRTGGYSHADIEPLHKEDTIKLRAIYNGKTKWKRRAVVVQIGDRKIAASLTGAPHGQGKVNDNDLYGKVGLYFSDEEKNCGISLSHKMMIWKAAGKTGNYLKKMSPEEMIIALFTAIDQHDLKSLNFMLKQPEEVNKNEFEQIIGVTVAGIKKKTLLQYDVSVSVSFKKGPYNQKRHVGVILHKDNQNECYHADNKFLDDILSPLSNDVRL